MSEYHIDFGSWIIEAASMDDAERKVTNLILTGESVPVISNIEENI